ncbi:hypothetical protein KOR42_34060 [Thalassoglobus neptunius]|uniref:RND transporter n=1 Tax=Thalassoglobus neptunius TaxID=1938619 RepID=A0A5C5WNN9_9PLAN|nr:RND transporter [Thalassoglobus neptunius]TWT51719.1 hypothetical protein KOR42_34060 [Thalassoglobus neptunius]
MRFKQSNWFLVLLTVPVLSLVLFTASGCNSGTDTATSPDSHAGENDETVASTDHDHSGWWCNEHGVPEDECALCKTSLIAEFKEKGDWCEEHNRPDSQCFECHPENFEKFAARYEAKYGEQPPKPTE